MFTSSTAPGLGALVLGAVLLAAGPGRAQSLDGTWQGRLRCEAAGTLGALSAPIKLSVTGSRITYEREVRNPSNRSQVVATETGSGTVAPDGQVRMSGAVSGAGWRQDSSYSGRLVRPSATLPGTITTFDRANNAGIERRCTITVSPG